MLKGFSELFNTVVTERVNEIGSGIIINDPEYKDSQSKLGDLLGKIKGMLPEGDKKLAENLDELIAYQESILQSIVFEQGLKDGIALKDILKMVG